MSEYKILVRSVEEIEKAQTLFEKLGFRKGECTTYDLPKYVVTVSDTLGNYSTGASLSYRNVACAPIQMSELEEIVKNWSNDLISGQEAKIAWAYGEDIEYNCAGKWTPLHEHNSLNIFDRNGVIFRRKPTTVKLEIDVPAPFKPKVGDYVYFICSDEIKGYAETTLEDTPMNWGFVQFGAWRTEAEIKIVVEQLRKLGVLK